MNLQTIPVLVLNRGYQPIGVTRCRRAIALLVKGRAEVVSVSDGTWSTYTWADWTRLRNQARESGQPSSTGIVGGDGQVIQLPSAIRVSYTKVPPRQVACSRRNLYVRDGFRCQYCGLNFKSSDLTLDHVIPKSRGGPFTWGNIVTACYGCNQKKAGRTPAECGMKLRRKPVRPEWKPRYAAPAARVDDWEALVGYAYWNTEMAGS